MARKRKQQARKAKQRRLKRLFKAEDDCRVAGDVPMVPAGAARNDAVDPATQDEQRFPGLDRLAIREDGNGKWNVPEHVARKVIEKAAEVLYERRTMVKEIEIDGKKTVIEVELPPDRTAEAQAAKTLLAADEKNWERENPGAAGKARGGSQVNVGVQVNNQIDPLALFQQALVAVERDEIEERIAAEGKK